MFRLILSFPWFCVYSLHCPVTVALWKTAFPLLLWARLKMSIQLFAHMQLYIVNLSQGRFCFCHLFLFWSFRLCVFEAQSKSGRMHVPLKAWCGSVLWVSLTEYALPVFRLEAVQSALHESFETKAILNVFVFTGKLFTDSSAMSHWISFYR